MKTESNIAPKKITVERYEGKADIILTENIVEIIRKEQIVYQYDSYRRSVTDRENLETLVSENFNQWFAFVKNEPVKSLTVNERVGSLEVTTEDMLTILEAII